MWVVRIVLKVLLNLVDEQSISERIPIENSTTNKKKAKQNILYIITGNLETSSNIINVENYVTLLYFIRLYCN
jgi:hypothetical protein